MDEIRFVVAQITHEDLNVDYQYYQGNTISYGFTHSVEYATWFDSAIKALDTIDNEKIEFAKVIVVRIKTTVKFNERNKNNDSRSKRWCLSNRRTRSTRG